MAGPVTQLLTDDADAPDLMERLVPLVYDELRVLARAHLRREYNPQTLATTELVHEAYAKLVGGSSVPASSRSHFFGAAARAMRQVIVDRARARQAKKRPQMNDRITFGGDGFDQVNPLATQEADDIVALHEALERLAQFDERAARVVELRYFGGLSVEETAEALGIGARTVKRDWRDARGWLYRALQEEDSGNA